MPIELLTKDDIREVLKEVLPGILAQLLPQADEQPVTAEEICHYFNISRPTLSRYRDQGRIDYIKIGRQYRYLKSKVKAALVKS